MKRNFEKAFGTKAFQNSVQTRAMLTFNVPFHWRQMNALIRCNMYQSHTSVNCRKGFYDFRAFGKFFLTSHVITAIHLVIHFFVYWFKSHFVPFGKKRDENFCWLFTFPLDNRMSIQSSSNHFLSDSRVVINIRAANRQISLTARR